MSFVIIKYDYMLHYLFLGKVDEGNFIQREKADSADRFLSTISNVRRTE